MSAGLSEDSDYTSDISYSNQQNHCVSYHQANSSSSQFESLARVPHHAANPDQHTSSPPASFPNSHLVQSAQINNLHPVKSAQLNTSHSVHPVQLNSSHPIQLNSIHPVQSSNSHSIQLNSTHPVQSSSSHLVQSAHLVNLHSIQPARMTNLHPVQSANLNNSHPVQTAPSPHSPSVSMHCVNTSSSQIKVINPPKETTRPKRELPFGGRSDIRAIYQQYHVVNRHSPVPAKFAPSEPEPLYYNSRPRRALPQINLNTTANDKER